MATSPRAFLIELYQEYLEEAAFLYEQWFTLFENRGITWKKIGEFEDRFEAHIDGLVVGEGLALEVCTRQANEGDIGEAHAAVRVFCRQNRKDLLLKVLERVDANDAARMKAIADALKYEIPELWQSDLVGFLRSTNPNLVLTAIEVIGYRRLKAGAELTRILEKSSSGVLAKAIWALGRAGESQASTLIFSYLLDGDGPVRSAAALALLRLRSEDALHYCLQRAGSEPWAILPMALGGGRNALELLLNQTATGKACAECLVGLGTLGFSAAIPILINYLANDETATSAANSLDRITGAGLREEVFIPEEVDEDELFEEEREKLKLGQVPTRADGRPFGSTVKRVSQKAEEWQRWWDERGTSMDLFTRYRNGVPYSPASLVSDLEQETTPHNARCLTYEELVIRYGFDIPFEADMFVAQQRKALVNATEWAQQQGTQVVNGRSYFAGRLMAE